MSYHLKLKTGFFKKEPISLQVKANDLVLETTNHKIITINEKDILQIDIINKYSAPEIEIQTKDKNYVIYLDESSEEHLIYKHLSLFFPDKFKH